MEEYYFDMYECGRNYQERHKSQFNVFEFGKIIIETKGSPFRIKCLTTRSYCTKEGLLLKDVKKQIYDIADKERIYKFEPFLKFNIRLQETTEISNQEKINLSTMKYIELNYIIAEIDISNSSKMFNEYVQKVQNFGDKFYNYLIEKHQYEIDQLVLFILKNQKSTIPCSFILSFYSVSTFRKDSCLTYNYERQSLSFETLGMQKLDDLCMLCSIALAIHRTLTEEKLFELFLNRQSDEKFDYKKSEYNKISSFNYNYFLIDNTISYYIDRINYKIENNSLKKW